MQNDNDMDRSSMVRRFLYRGGAGILSALFLIVFFILCATWLKSVVFGLMLAFLFLPLEKWYERLLFRNKKISHFRKATSASAVSILSFLLLLFVLMALALSLLIPFVANTGDNFAEWCRTSETVQSVEKTVNGWFTSKDGQEFYAAVRVKMANLASENKEKLALFALKSGKGVLHALLSGIFFAGGIAGEFLLTLLFFFYFLQKMAMFNSAREENGEKKSVSSWLVDTMFHSAWLPNISDETRKKTVEILAHIGAMLGRWLRGYCIIVVIEMVIYTTAFLLIGVPYPFLAGPLAGCAILVPVIGFAGSILLTAGLCLVFCESSVLLTLVLAGLVYAVVCAVEETVLYPKCIGNALGLTMLESIIVVLIGVMLFGIAGMLLALPTAAVIKYLIPEIYKVLSGKKEEQSQ